MRNSDQKIYIPLLHNMLYQFHDHNLLPITLKIILGQFKNGYKINGTNHITIHSSNNSVWRITLSSTELKGIPTATQHDSARFLLALHTCIFFFCWKPLWGKIPSGDMHNQKQNFFFVLIKSAMCNIQHSVQCLPCSWLFVLWAKISQRVPCNWCELTRVLYYYFFFF